MRIGILTFHSETNYGSVLQTLALQTHLQGLGHEVVVIDKWEDADNHRLLGPFSQRSFRFWASYLIRAVCFSSGFARIRRHIKTIMLIRRCINRTNYHFYKWRDAPKDLAVDLIIVGSDQVWNPNIVDPEDYLLANIPGNVPGIAYAASIGQHHLDNRRLQEYKVGFRRFKAIGVREIEAKRLIEETGSAATHVVDPTLLVDPGLCWKRFMAKKKPHRPILFAYLMTPAIGDVLPVLLDFAATNNADVELFLDRQMLPFPFKGIEALKKFLRTQTYILNPRIHVRFSGAPDDFVRAISRAKWVLTESFHGLMFATIFRKDTRVVILGGGNGGRQAMSSRLTEFAESIIFGPLVFYSIKEALSSLSSGVKISYDELELSRRIDFSRRWLNRNIDIVNAESFDYE